MVSQSFADLVMDRVGEDKDDVGPSHALKDELQRSQCFVVLAELECFCDGSPSQVWSRVRIRDGRGRVGGSGVGGWSGVGGGSGKRGLWWDVGRVGGRHSKG